MRIKNEKARKVLSMGSDKLLISILLITINNGCARGRAVVGRARHPRVKHFPLPGSPRGRWDPTQLSLLFCEDLEALGDCILWPESLSF